MLRDSSRVSHDHVDHPVIQMTEAEEMILAACGFIDKPSHPAKSSKQTPTSKGRIIGTTQLVAGYGGQNGFYYLKIISKTGFGAAGTFKVGGGSINYISIHDSGQDYQDARLDFSNCSGLTGASAKVLFLTDAQFERSSHFNPDGKLVLQLLHKKTQTSLRMVVPVDYSQSHDMQHDREFLKMEIRLIDSINRNKRNMLEKCYG